MVSVAVSAGLVARFVIKELIVLVYHRPRPYMVLPHLHTLISSTVTDNFQSFPSGHAVFFFALAVVLYFFHKKIGAWYFIAAILMGVARIFVGVHWPTDIIAGAAIGILVAYATQLFYRKHRSKIDLVIHSIFKNIGI